MSAAPRPLPLGLRMINRVGPMVERSGILTTELDPDALCALAVQRSGLTDFGDPSFRPALERLLDSVQTDARLHFLGRRFMHQVVLRALEVRLRLAARAPEADALPLRPPLVICGLPRSGTTFLHRLLALADDAQALPLWELMEPVAGPGPDRRRVEAERRMARLARVVPHSIDAQHLMRADLPDECGHLFKPAFLSSLLWMVPATGWLEWMHHQDFGPAYADYRRLLALLARPDRRLVLKDPFHAMHLPALFSAVPDARVVQTHRAPSEVVPSFHKLCLTLHAVFAEDLDLQRIVTANTDWLAHLAQRSVDDRVLVPAGQVLDVDYRDLVRDPVDTCRRIHAHFGLPFDEALEARMQAFVAENGQRKHGPNPYSAEDYGQTTAGIGARFQDYRSTYGLD